MTSNVSLSPIKSNSNISNNFNNEVIIPLFIFVIFAVYSIMCELPVGTGEFFKHGNKIYDKIFVIGIPDLLTNLMSCNGFLKNKNYIVILKCPKRMLEYYL